MPYTPDSLIMPILQAVLQCVCDEFTEAGLNDHCECALIPGVGSTPFPPAPGMGTAWVGVNYIYPTTAIPEQAIGGDCSANLGANITVGSMRCYKITKETPSVDDMLLYMDKQMADMAALRRAIMCCDGLKDYEMVVGQYTPIEFTGGMFGGAWTVDVGLY